jgi:hypothetical protein
MRQRRMSRSAETAEWSDKTHARHPRQFEECFFGRLEESRRGFLTVPADVNETIDQVPVSSGPSNNATEHSDLAVVAAQTGPAFLPDVFPILGRHLGCLAGIQTFLDQTFDVLSRLLLLIGFDQRSQILFYVRVLPAGNLLFDERLQGFG